MIGLPVVPAHGASAKEAMAKARALALALRAIANRIEHGESEAMAIRIDLAA